MVATESDLSVQTLVSTLGLSDRHHQPGETARAPVIRGLIDLEPYVRIAKATAPETMAVGRAWRPDLVMYEPTTYAGPMTAAALGVPAVRHLWGVDYLQRFQKVEPYALAGLCASLDLPIIDARGDLTVDCCPPSMQVPDDPDCPAPRRLRTRYLPYNGRSVLPPWLIRRPERRRVCVTWGTTGVSRGPYYDTLRGVVEAVAGLDAEVVVTLSAADAAEVGTVPPNVRLVTMLALNLLLPTCNAIVAQGGLGTMMTAAALGVPALVVPQSPDHMLNAAQLAATGAGRVLPFVEATPAAIHEAAGQLLEDQDAAGSARALAAEIARQTSPADAVRVLEALVAEHANRPVIAAAAAPQRTSLAAATRLRPARQRAPRALVTIPRWSIGTGTAMVPFARALRLAGFDVLIAGTPEYRGPAVSCGLPTVSVGQSADAAAMRHALFTAPGRERAVEMQAKDGMAGFVGLRGRMELPEAERGEWAERWRRSYVSGIRAAVDSSAAVIEDTVALARAWRPDLVAFGPNSFAGPVAGALLGVPTIRHLSWADQSAVLGPFESEALAPLWERHGLGEPDVFGSLTLDPCPMALSLYTEHAVVAPHVHASSAGGRLLSDRSSRPVRYVPFEGCDTTGFMGAAWSDGGGRPKVCVAIDSAAGWPDQSARSAATVIDALAGLEVDVLAAASARDREELGRLPGNTRLVDPRLLNGVLPECAALVTSGEPDILLSAITSVCPMLVLPQLPEQALRAHRISQSGAGITLVPAAADARRIAAAVGSLISEPSFRVPLRRMRTEMLDKPAYDQIVATICESL